jgi:zinc transport system permease protein
MIAIFANEFMQLALLAAVITGLSAPLIGTYLVQRRMALMGDGIGHIAVTGVSLGLLTHASPIWTAIIVAVAGAVLIEVIRERGHASGDVALALLFYGGLAGGVLLTGVAGKSAASLQSYLFGSILTLSRTDVGVTIALAVLALVILVGLGPQLYAVALDSEYAHVAGLNVRMYNMLIAVLAAVTVTAAMRTVGLLLVSALMVVPVATAQQLTRSFRSTVGLAMGVGAAAAVGGLLISTYASVSFDLNVTPGPAIVLLALFGFVLTWPEGASGFSHSPPAWSMNHTAQRRTMRTCTETIAGTWESGMEITSTTSMTVTGTPLTESTMTSTDRDLASPLTGVRATRQRLAVAQALASISDFRSAQEIHELLAERGESVGLATVYRTLQRLADADEVDVLRTEDGEAIYRRCSDTHHHHLVCRECGVTVEVEGPTVEKWTSAIAGIHGFSQISHTLEIFGRCPACTPAG